MALGKGFIVSTMHMSRGWPDPDMSGTQGHQGLPVDCMRDESEEESRMT